MSAWVLSFWDSTDADSLLLLSTRTHFSSKYDRFFLIPSDLASNVWFNRDSCNAAEFGGCIVFFGAILVGISLIAGPGITCSLSNRLTSLRTGALGSCLFSGAVKHCRLVWLTSYNCLGLFLLFEQFNIMVASILLVFQVSLLLPILGHVTWLLSLLISFLLVSFLISVLLYFPPPIHVSF